MAIDVVPILFGPLLVIWAIYLVYLAVSGRRRPATSASTLGLGRGRLAVGYLAVFVVCMVSAYFDTIALGSTKVAAGDVTQLEAGKYFWGWYVSLFSLSTPLYFFLLTVVGLPALAALRRLRLMSIVGACACSQVIALGLAVLPVLVTPDDWCRAHPVECWFTNFTDSAPPALAVALAFAVGARLPALRWIEHAS